VLRGGQQHGVACAGAIVGDPAVVLADEPTAALDSENGAVVMTLLAKMAENPACALFVVTHDPRIIPFCDRILHIEDGRVVADERHDRRNGSILTLKYASRGAA
jgi:putative ABC transport system ATP-binding protein